MASNEVLQQRLEDAETALHALAIGEKEASVSYDGKTVTFTQTNMPKLRAYIAELKNSLGLKTSRRSIGIYF